MGQLEVRSPSQPATGWRYWQLAIGGAVALQSLSQRGFVWRPGRTMVARCADSAAPEQQHPDVPAIDCGCGIYASIDLASLHAQALCLRPVPLVIGEVVLWGRVLTEERADGRGQDRRGQFAYPLHLSVVTETLGGTPVGEAVEALGIYQVPVGATSLDEAVGELSRTIMVNLSMSRPT